MTEAIAPKPKALTRKLSPLQRLIKGRHSSLSVLYERSYSMHMGEFWTPIRNIYFVNQPDIVDRVLSKESGRFPKSNLMSSMLSLLLGDGIFVSNGELWKKQRRMLDPAFNQARIQDVFPLMRDAADGMVDRLSRHRDGDVLNIEEETTHVTADIIFRTIFSRPLRREEAARIFRAFSRFQEIVHAQGVWAMAGLPGFLSPSRFFAARHARVIRGLLEQDVQSRLDEVAAKPGAGERRDILASLLQAVDPVSGDKFTRRELVDQIAVLFLAGHETSASALAWAVYLLAVRPDIQDRLHAEAAGVFGKAPPGFGDIKRLKLARDVFRETLRLYPPVSFISRDVTEVEHMRDKVLPPGSLVFISPWLIQRHRQLWDRPDVFDPDRFSEPGAKESLRSAYLPFSAGPRVCLGASFAMQEAVLILACLAYRFRFEPIDGQTPAPIGRLTLRSENGIHIRLFRRPAETARSARTESDDAARAECPFM